MLRINEAAKRLGVTPGTLRRWEEQGLIVPDRTAGGERRYHEGELDQLAARIAHPPVSGGRDRDPPRRTRAVALAAPDDEDPPDIDGGPHKRPSPPEPPPWERKVQEARADSEVRRLERENAELDRVEQEAARARDARSREAARLATEAQARDQAVHEEERRLASLRAQGDMMAAMTGAPVEYRAAVTRDLATYVTAQQFPPGSWQQTSYLSARVEKILKPWREMQAKEKHEAAQKREDEHRRLQCESLVRMGLSIADNKTVLWRSRDRADALQDVEEALKDEVEYEWTGNDVAELVDEILAEWE